MRHFRVLHDFKGEEAVELSVYKGEVLFAPENTVQDGWIKVECVEDPARRGFVPLSYLQEISQEEAVRKRSEHKTSSSPRRTEQPLHQVRTPSPRSQGRGTGAAPAGARGSSPSAAATSPEPRGPESWRDGNRALEEAALDYGAGVAAAAATASSRSPRDRSATTPHGRSTRRSATRAGDDASDAAGSLTANAPLTPARASTGGALIDRDLLSNPNTVVEAFMKNEVYFKQLMRRRADALTQMQSGLDEAVREVGACKDKNAALTRKLRELDQVLEKERRRWTERVEEEKAFVARSLTYVPGNALGLAGGSSPSRRSGSRQSSPAGVGNRSAVAALTAGSPSVY